MKGTKVHPYQPLLFKIGKTFVGKAGKYLNKVLNKKEDIKRLIKLNIIPNILKCTKKN